MKKLLASALAVLMAGAMLTGCGDSDSSAAETTTTTTTKGGDAAVEESTEDSADVPAEDSKEEEGGDDKDVPVYDAAATESVIINEDSDTGAWANCFGGSYIDYHTLPRDTDLHFTVEVKLSDTFIGMMEADILNGDEQIGLAPTSMDAVTGWKHLGEEVNYVDGDFPIGNKLKALDGYNDGTYMVKAKLDDDGNPKLDKDGNVKFEEDVYMVEDDTKMAPLYMKPDGFIKWSDEAWMSWGSDTQTLEFTLTKDCVNFILDSIEAAKEAGEVDENGVNGNDYGGILFQCSGNFEVNKVTIDYGNILISDDYQAWAEANPGAVWGE